MINLISRNFRRATMIRTQCKDSDTVCGEYSSDGDIPTLVATILDSDLNPHRSANPEELSPACRCKPRGLDVAETPPTTEEASFGEKTQILQTCMNESSVKKEISSTNWHKSDVEPELSTSTSMTTELVVSDVCRQIPTDLRNLPPPRETLKSNDLENKAFEIAKKNDQVLVKELQRAVQRVKWVISSQPLFRTCEMQLSLLSLVEFFLYLIPNGKARSHINMKGEFRKHYRNKIITGNYTTLYRTQKYFTVKAKVFLQDMQSTLENRLKSIGEHAASEKNEDEIVPDQLAKASGWHDLISETEFKKTNDVETAANAMHLISENIQPSPYNEADQENLKMAEQISENLCKLQRCPNEDIYTVLDAVKDLLPEKHLKKFNDLKRSVTNPHMNHHPKLRYEVGSFLQRVHCAIERRVPVEYRSAVAGIKVTSHLMKKEEHCRYLIKQVEISRRLFMDIKEGSTGSRQKFKYRTQLHALSAQMMEYNTTVYENLLCLLDKFGRRYAKNVPEEVCVQILRDLQSFEAWCEMKIRRIMCELCQDVQTEILEQPKFTFVIAGLRLVESIAMGCLPDAFTSLLTVLCPSNVKAMILTAQQLNAVMSFMDHLKKSVSSCTIMEITSRCAPRATRQTSKSIRITSPRITRKTSKSTRFSAEKVKHYIEFRKAPRAAAKNITIRRTMDALAQFCRLEKHIPKHLRGRYARLRERIERAVKNKTMIGEALSGDVCTYLKKVENYLRGKVPAKDRSSEDIRRKDIKPWNLSLEVKDARKVFLEMFDEVREKTKISKETAELKIPADPEGKRCHSHRCAPPVLLVEDISR